MSKTVGLVQGGANNGRLIPAVQQQGQVQSQARLGGQGVAWQECYGDGAGLNKVGMLNEAIVWPK